MIGILVLLGVTILLGDRVGVTIRRVAPLGTARSTSSITIQFSEAMNRPTAASRLRTIPEMDGEVQWSGTTMIFRPSEPIPPGEMVEVVLDAGSLSETGREVLSEYRYTFQVRTPLVAYMYPSDSWPQNIWVVDPNNPTERRQITQSPSGVYDFSVSPDGTQIAFSENNTNGTSDIKLIDLETGGLTQITNCADATCTTPVWRPDGNTIAYTRSELNSDLEQMGSSPLRVWLIDLTASPATTRPLFSDLQILGHSPQWSADGNRIAIFDSSSVSILVYDFLEGTVISVPSNAGASGALSPDGHALVFPELFLAEGQSARTYLRLADLDTGEVVYLSTPDGEFNDSRAVWQPSGENLAVARQSMGARGYQIHLVTPDGLESVPITSDPLYSNLLFWWDPTGTRLVVQRFPQADQNMQVSNLGRPEIWTINVETGESLMVAENGFIPTWIP